jgi:transposase InsO family protein
LQYHANAKLTLRARRDLVERMLAGWSVSEIAEMMNVSRPTVYKWWARWRAEGDAGLADRSSRPHRCPHQTPVPLKRRIERLRRDRKLGPARIAGIVQLHASTVHRVLVRQRLNRLRWLDRATGRVIRRIETSRPGELVHVDTKKLSRIPQGGGWRAHGWETRTKNRQQVGYDHVHSMIDAYSRVAYSEILPVEDAEHCTAFLQRAARWFADRGITIQRVLTDNGVGYRSFAWRDLCAQLGIEHTRTRPYTPRTNGKAERFNRTLLDEWAYARTYRSDLQRADALDRWLHTQPSPLPHRPRRPSTHEPHQRPTWAQQLTQAAERGA